MSRNYPMRRHDWPVRFAAIVAEGERGSFVYGQSDCACFARAVVLAVREGDVDPFAGLPAWNDEASAAAAIATGGDLRAHLEMRFEPVPIGMAKRGDIGLADTPEGDLIVVVDNDALIAPAPQGLSRLKRARLKSAYRV